MTDENTLDLMPDAPLPDEPQPEQQSAEAEQQEHAARSESGDAPADTPEDGKGAAEGEDKADEKPKRNRTPAKARIGQLTRQVRELERQLAEVSAKPPPAPPRQDDFATYDEYIRAQARHEAASALDAREADRLQAEHDQARREAESLSQAEMQEQVSSARAKHADFDAVAFNPEVTITSEMAGFLRQSEQFADLAYHLGKNPDEAEKIAALPPLDQVRALVRLEDRLSAPPPQPKTTKAPPPPPTVSGSSGAGKDPSRMSYEEYKRFRLGK